MIHHFLAQRSRTFLGVLLLLTLFGCEHTVEDPEWPEYKEKLVIVAKCIVHAADSLSVFCRISRTLPLTTTWTDSAAFVNDADARITCDGREYLVPFDRYSSNYRGSFYQAYYHLTIPRNGVRDLMLTVRHGGKTAYSTLHLEDAPVFDSIDVLPGIQGDSILLARIIPGAMARFRIQLLVRYYRWGWGLVGHYGDFVPEGTNSNAVFLAWVSVGNSLNGTAKCMIEAESPEYSDYMDALNHSTDNGDLFGNDGGKNPPFNVKGDGIGFFWYEVWGPEVEVKW